jgi:hypothetical protein
MDQELFGLGPDFGFDFRSQKPKAKANPGLALCDRKTGPQRANAHP